MKKIIIIFIVFLISILIVFKKDYNDITKTTNVSSIAVEYKDEYIVTMYFLNNFMMSKSEYSSNDSYAYTIKGNGKTIHECFDKIENSINVFIDYTHLSTLIIHESFIKKEYIEQLINEITNEYKYYHDFYYYVTKDEIKDIYNVKFFNDISSYYSILVNPIKQSIGKVPTFNDLLNNCTENISTAVPILKLNKDQSSQDDKKQSTLSIDKSAVINNYEVNYLKDDKLYYFMPFCFRNEFEYEDSKILDITQSYFYLKDSIFIYIHCKSTKYIDLSQKLKEFIKDNYEKELDFYNLKYKNINVENIKIKFICDIKKN